MNPLTSKVPETPGEIITAAIAHWEDVLFDARSRRPRKPEEKRAKADLVAKASDRLARYRTERRVIAFNPKRGNKTTLQLATDDLAQITQLRSAA